MSTWQFRKGLQDLGNGCYAYLQPDGSWGWSNAALVVDGKETLLVDTLFDLHLTREMLDTMRAKVPAAASIGTVVNTHSNGDHTFGNQLVQGAKIIASRACVEEMVARPPAELVEFQRDWRDYGEGGAFFMEMMGRHFKFDEVVLTLPTETFEKELRFTVGDKEVQLVNVGPAHTGGDTLVYVPKDRTVFTGDILFMEGHPVLWAGPIDNWIKACDLMLGWDAETVVPGHGPITDKGGVRRFKEYLQYIKSEARRRFDAGMPPYEAALDISLDRYAGWLDPERIVINVLSLYREFGGTPPTRPDRAKLFGDMSRYRKAKFGDHAHPHPH